MSEPDNVQIKAFSTFLLSYAKRSMEKGYDMLLESSAARPLLNLEKGPRYGIEALLYALSAFIDHKWKDRTPAQHFLKELAMDAPSEIGKRLVNGFRDSVISGRSESASRNNAIRDALLELEDAELLSILKWYAQSGRGPHAGRVKQLASELSCNKVSRAESRSPGTESVSKPANPTVHSGGLSDLIRSDLNAAKTRLKNVNQRSSKSKE